VEQAKIIIDVLDPNNMKEQGKDLERKGAKAIIARSGGYRHTVGRVNVPVIHLKITTLDILHAIKTAAKIRKNIVLVISDLEYFNYEDWKDVINEEIIIERFHDGDNIEEIVIKYAKRKDQVVIVGGGIPCSHARKWGIDNVPIGAADESIYEGVAHARELVGSLKEQKYKNQVLKTVLDGVHDAVIAINVEGKIIIYNERAKELLKKENSEVLDKNLIEVYPELSFIIEVIKDKVNRYNEIRNLSRIVIAANTSLLESDGNIHGVLCSFQDITKLQSLEKKIRYELNKKGLVAKYRFQDIVSHDSFMNDTIAKAINLGLTDSTVMVYGESGTGKEMIAQSIHNISRRKDEPFVAINCAALTESLLESELFGYEEGAFTGARKGGKPGLFELAHGGTIFLDEINSISMSLQAKLLRVLEEKEIMRIGSDRVIPLDVRIIAAANEKLKNKVREGTFRNDLFYRLNILEIHIPTLRERKNDIIPLFMHFVENLSHNRKSVSLSREEEEKLLNYPWPGNVRELRNIAERYTIFEELDIDEEEVVVSNIENLNEEDLKKSDIQKDFESDKIIDLKEINRYVEEKVIEMLSNKGMNKTEIAKQLCISRTALWKKTKT
jgi:propionate catabolism operon transcriptional regulator